MNEKKRMGIRHCHYDMTIAFSDKTGLQSGLSPVLHQ